VKGGVAFFECTLPHLLEFVFVVFAEAFGVNDDEVVVVFMGVVDSWVHRACCEDAIINDAKFVVHQTGAVGLGIVRFELMEVVVVGDDFDVYIRFLCDGAQGLINRGKVDFV